MSSTEINNGINTLMHEFGLNNIYLQGDTIHTTYIHNIMWRIWTKAYGIFGSSPQNIISYRTSTRHINKYCQTCFKHISISISLAKFDHLCHKLQTTMIRHAAVGISSCKIINIFPYQEIISRKTSRSTTNPTKWHIRPAKTQIKSSHEETLGL